MEIGAVVVLVVVVGLAVVQVARKRGHGREEPAYTQWRRAAVRDRLAEAEIAEDERRARERQRLRIEGAGRARAIDS
jgi:uncharacterized membrane protein